MVAKTVDLEGILNRDTMAHQIAEEYDRYNIQRQEWLSEKRELRNYIFATDTTTTTNKKLPWKNSTTLPKLCQIRDNLHANYTASLFPHSDWLSWEGGEDSAETFEKRKVITSYISNKIETSNYKNVISNLLYDFVDYGNCFAMVEWEADKKTDPETGEEIYGYVGPVLKRISPEDIVFNPLATDFRKTPKIIRSVKTLGELKKMAQDLGEDSDEAEMFRYAVDRALNARKAIAGISQSDISKQERLYFDGFGTLHEYYGSNYVEVLTFYGDLYDVTGDELYEDKVITIIDKSYVVSIKDNQSWLPYNQIFHAGWRYRQDNLYAMGPLDNLVGMQYRIDHLENLKADVFDMVAFPMLRVKGFVEDFDFGPNERIYLGDDGDVGFLSPDVTALNADNQIAILENKMEEMAGAPKQAMGIRTPGEKTAYEVQRLENAASRIFQSKILHFETTFHEPVLNSMLEVARRNMTSQDTIRTFDDETSAILFQTITKEDITAKGKLRPKGASHFARKAQIVQNLTSLQNSIVGQDPAVNVHLSGKKMAQMLEDLLDFEANEIYQPNVRILEQGETQQMQMAVQQQLQQQQQGQAINEEIDQNVQAQQPVAG